MILAALVLRQLERFRRISSTRGYGVQSPWAYWLIRSVLCEHTPYYAYRDMRIRHQHLNRHQRSLHELYFRLANAFQPAMAIDLGRSSSSFADYVQAACSQTQVESFPNVAHVSASFFSEVSHPVLVRVVPESNNIPSIQCLLDSLQQPSVLIVEPIHGIPGATNLWKILQADARTGVTFDLYDCGLVFFDKKLHKAHYCVNY